MKTKPTREFLKIFWHGDEVTGLTLYAYAKGQNAQPSFPLDFWPKESHVKSSKLSGEGWLVWVWDVSVKEWPREWKNVVHSTLLKLCGPGIPVSWCGLEGCFADPPDLLSPTAMADGVYAAFSLTTGFVCHTDIDEPFAPLRGDELLALKSQLKCEPHKPTKAR